MSTPHAVPSICELLKERTRAHHDRAEAALPLLDPGLTLAQYRETLQAFHAFYAPLEAALARCADWPALGLDWEARRKVPLLARDLRALAAAADVGAAARPASRRAAADLPDVATLPHGLGCLYVLEGATLGGQIIRRHVARTLGLDAEHGAAFFGAYGARVGPMWREFQTFLDATVERERCAPAAVVAGACDTFDALTRSMSHPASAHAA